MTIDRDKTNREKGTLFEKKVFDLLSLRGVHKLSREKQLSSKKVDLYFEVDSFGARRRYAVECKDHSAVLRQKDVAAIHSGYLGLFKTNEITDLLIVSNSTLAPSAKSFVDSIPTVSHQTLAELRSSLIDFQRYLTGYRERFTADSTFNYYVDMSGTLRDANGSTISVFAHSDAKSLILDELGKSEKPLIVLGAYGIGKTTLAKRIFLELLEARQHDPEQRIPIYVSLDRMANEQNLEGLLGTLFTSGTSCDGYNFDLFCALNATDQFVLLLDGVDEMRHRLTWEEFQYNLEQLELLITKNTRSVLFGRPTAFMSKKEYRWAVRAEPFEERALTLNTRTPYQEVEIEQLDDEKIVLFVEKYCAWKYPNQSALLNRASDLLFDDAKPKLRDIARRPVQLMMLLELLPQLNEPLDRITHATVYCLFVDELVRRETTKQTRRHSKAQQRLFAQRVATWLWVRGSGGEVEASQIGGEVLSPFVKDANELEVVRRSLVSGSFLSAQGGTHLQFPHRSIQEYLIAEFIATQLAVPGAMDAESRLMRFSIEQLLSTEIIEFLVLQLSGPQIGEFIDTIAEMKSIPPILKQLLVEPEHFEILARRLAATGNVTAAWLCVSNIIVRNDRKQVLALVSVFRSLIENLAGRYRVDSSIGRDRLARLGAYLLCVLVLMRKFELGVHIFLAILFLLEKFGSSKLPPIAGRGRSVKMARSQHFLADPTVAHFFNSLSYGIDAKGIDASVAARHILAEFPPCKIFDDWIFGDDLSVPGVPLLDRMPFVDEQMAHEFGRLFHRVSEWEIG